jgi:hypothetical protein
MTLTIFARIMAVQFSGLTLEHTTEACAAMLFATRL